MKMTGPIVTTAQGQLRGMVSEDYKGNKFYSFLGIPYAKPPIGDLRFKAPQPPEPWSGVRDATKEGPEVPCKHIIFEHILGSEEGCLNLNVFTRELSSESSKLRPVMFYIHGGAFQLGSNKREMYGPGYLLSEDIVLVVTNYRVGMLGFLSMEDPSLGVPGNAGLKDMVMALKWVQNNIVNFSGDPNNVTIFGESAGSAAVHYLLLSPLTEGLFHKAILQSGCSLNGWTQGTHNSKSSAQLLGYKETEDEREILMKLRSEPIKNIVIAQRAMKDFFISSKVPTFAPVVEKNSEDPAFLTEDPLTLLKDGKFHNVPIIIGYNTDEGLLYEAMRRLKPSLKLNKDFEIEIPHNLGIKKGTEKSKEVAAKIKKYYFGDEDPTEENIDKVYKLKGDTHFVYGIHQALDHHFHHATNPVYVYVMSLDGPLNYLKKAASAKYFKTYFALQILSARLNNVPMVGNIFAKLKNIIPCKQIEGVGHGDDVGYLFTSIFSNDIVPGSIEDIYIQRFLKLWSNFARHGNPTPDDISQEVLKNVKWKPANTQAFNYLDIGNELRMAVDPDVKRMKFWREINN